MVNTTVGGHPRRGSPRRRGSCGHGPGLRGHPLRDRRAGRRHHHRPAGALQRLPRPHRRGAHPCVPQRVGRQGHPGDHPDRRGGEGLLHGRRRQAACRDRRLRPHAERHVRDRQPAQADPRHPQAGHRRRQRRGGRRRARPARPLRHLHRQRDRPLRPGRPAGGLVRRRVRLGIPGTRRRGEEGPRDVVSLPAVHRRAGRAHGAGQRRGPGRPADGRGQGVGHGDRREEPDGASASSSSRSTPTPTTRPG